MSKNIFEKLLVEEIPPPVLESDELKAAAEALEKEFEKLSSATREVLHLPRLDELAGGVLDRLAWQYHADFYEPTEMTLETKRKLIRESIKWHRIKGTKAAIEQLANAVFRSAKIEEWFEYGGRPYYFRITSTGLFDNGDETDTFFRMIDAAKNERSWLDDILFDLTHEGTDLNINVGLLNDCGGKIDFDAALPEIKPLNIFPALIIQDAGYIEIEDFIGDTDGVLSIFLAALEHCGGYVEIDMDAEEVEPDDERDFLRLCRERWRKWKNNPVIKYYKHDSTVYDGEFVEDDLSDEFFPAESEFLRIYFGFPDKRVRYITLLNPIKNITGSQINEIGAFMVDNNILMNSNGIYSTGVKRALLITKSEEKIF